MKFLDSPAVQVLIIGGVALVAFEYLKGNGKAVGTAAADTVTSAAVGTEKGAGSVISTAYEGGKDFGSELASDITKAWDNLTALVTPKTSIAQGATVEKQQPAPVTKLPISTVTQAAAAKLTPETNTSVAILMAQVANAVGYTSANPVVAAYQGTTAAAKTVTAGVPIAGTYGATVAKGASITVGGITYKGV